MITTVGPGTDLEFFVGKRVRILRTVNGRRCTYTGVFASLWHDHTVAVGGGMLTLDDTAGQTGLHLAYHDAEIELINDGAPG